MTKTTIAWSIGACIFLVAVVFIGVAHSRGALSFSGGRIHFSLASFKNPPPSLDRPINFPVDFTPEARELFNTQLAKTKDVLKNNPEDVSAWLDLAIRYRMVGDHEGAIEIWKYISALYPQDGITLHNLGEYYFHTAKDYPTAESYYMRAITAAPTMEQNYFDLADMYQYVYKQDTSAAADILKKGIQNVEAPTNIDIMIRLGQYYADGGDSKNARLSYGEALKAAQSLHNQGLAAQINQALSRLK